uniref:Uncharacterized protein n=1 Tax=Arundo donax TaxID=35708 RepID=A0A0A9EUX6_ARUDO
MLSCSSSTFCSLDCSNSLSMQCGILVYHLHVLSEQSLKDRLIFMATSGEGDG